MPLALVVFLFCFFFRKEKGSELLLGYYIFHIPLKKDNNRRWIFSKNISTCKMIWIHKQVTVKFLNNKYGICMMFILCNTIKLFVTRRSHRSCWGQHCGSVFWRNSGRTEGASTWSTALWSRQFGRWFNRKVPVWWSGANWVSVKLCFYVKCNMNICICCAQIYTNIFWFE